MHRYLFLISAIVLFAGTLRAQDFSGQWEGQVRYFRGSTGVTLNLRLELIQSENTVYGVLYSRGAEKGTVFGCDYFMQGTIRSNRVQLTIAAVQRSVALSKEDCYALEQVVLQWKDSTTAAGEWIWVEESSKLFTVTKTSPDISFSAEEEIITYFQQKTALYDSLGVIVPPFERLRIFDRKLLVSEASVVLEIGSGEAQAGDSVSMYMNDNQVVTPRNVSLSPLRIRLNLPDTGEVELMFVNESKIRPVARIRVAVTSNGKRELYNLELTGTKNLYWLLEFNKEEP